jgi:hypothetical protein
MTTWHGRDEQTREQERHMWWLFSAVVAILFFVTGFGAGARHDDSGSREPQIRCASEDEVAVELLQDAYGEFQKSHLACVHIDSLRGEDR